MSTRKRLPPLAAPAVRVEVTFDVPDPFGNLDEVLADLRRVLAREYSAKIRAWTLTLGKARQG